MSHQIATVIIHQIGPRGPTGPMGPDGPESLPVLTRTAAQGVPSGTAQIDRLTIVIPGGLTTAGTFVFFVTTHELGLTSFELYTPGGQTPTQVAALLAATGAIQSALSGEFTVTSDGPDLVLTGVSLGVNDETLVFSVLAEVGLTATSSVSDQVADPAPTPAGIGQRCVTGDSGAGELTGNGNYLEYTSDDGATWRLSGPPGVHPSSGGNIVVTDFTGEIPTFTLTSITEYLTA